MKVIIALVIGYLAIRFILFIARKSRENTDSVTEMPQKANSASKDREYATGCASHRLACKYANHNKTRELGLSNTEQIYCEAHEGVTDRVDNCKRFCAMGCKSCMYANDRTESSCFCAFYGRQVNLKESCIAFMDYFDTKQGKASAAAILKSIREKPME